MILVLAAVILHGSSILHEMVSVGDIFLAQVERSLSLGPITPSVACPGGWTSKAALTFASAPPVCFVQEHLNGEPLVLSKGNVVMLSMNVPGHGQHRYSEEIASLELCVALVMLCASRAWPKEGAHWQCAEWVNSAYESVQFKFGPVKAGDYRAAAQLRFRGWKPDPFTGLLKSEEMTLDGAGGPMHITDISLIDGRGSEKPGDASIVTPTLGAKFDFILGGFPKTGTSTLWQNLGLVSRVNMYGTEPEDWHEITRWRRELFKLSTTDNDAKLLGFKVTKFMYDRRWAMAALELNPSTKFVLSLRKPSMWLRSFVKYRQSEIAGAFLPKAGNEGKWARTAVEAEPSLRNATFADVAISGIDLLGAHRDRGHFHLFLGPILQLFGEHALPSAKERVFVVMLEQMAAEPFETHNKIAQFLGIGPSELPLELQIANRNNPRSPPGGPLFPNGVRSPHDVVENGSEWCDEHGICQWFSDEAVLIALDEFYATSTAELNYILKKALGYENKWW